MNDFGYQAMFEGQPKIARRAFERSLALDPSSPSANGGLWLICSQSTPGRSCLDFLAKELSGVGFGELAGRLESLPASTTFPEATKFAGDWLEDRALTSRVPLGLGAAVLIAAGELDRAEAWIRRAFQERDPELVWLAMDPTWGPVRGRASIQEILRAMHLAPAGE